MAIDQEKANIMRIIYQRYFSGMSQGGIANFLFEQGIPSAKGKERWTQDENTNRKNGYLVQLAEPTGRPFVCAECGHSYRHITRLSVGIIWRCTSRMEHGK
ncbi:recombinase family protein [Anaerotruncus colihominis]|uniref:Recombinase domain-containing protein n=2 Tax=Anaerotruncus colihominis TaxID=169435 RepID=B0PGU5_9FIRM|nr:recombinase family protein [Anaerotruncus colihominis]EDS09193.1 hypothetical protein ANACOL_03963 [Anaerotruncus colihominis DSM 17241]MCQ4732720.1 recombinase family protein [Anaerotruncus colihominis]UWN75321.1 recombinase family protein [Anaerotruncus colihominis]